MKHDGSLPRSKEPATGPHPDPHESNLHLPILYPRDPFWY